MTIPATASPRSRGLKLSGLAVVVAVLWALIAPSGIAFASTSALSGVVTSPTGTTLAGVAVAAVDVATLDTVATTTTSSSGAFSFASIAAGEYTVRFGATSKTFEQYLGRTSEASEARTVTVSGVAGATVSVRAGLAPAGIVAGSVKSSAGVALAGATVTAWRETSSGLFSHVTEKTSSATGTFSLTGLEPGVYKLRATKSPFAASYSGAKATLSSASTVVVSADATTKASFVLAKAGSIAGIVNGDCGACAGSTELLEGVTVTPYRLGETPERLEKFAVETNASGGFVVTGLAAGAYALQFSATSTHSTSGTVYGTEFSGNVDDPAAVVPISVASGAQTKNAGITLVPAGSLALSLISPLSEPVANVRVSVGFAAEGDERLASSLSNGMGLSSFEGLAPGNYVVTVGSHTDEAGDGVTEDTSWKVMQLPVTITEGQASDLGTVGLSAKDAGGLKLATPLTITAGGSVGSTFEITSDTSVWNAPVDTIAVQWLRNGSPIIGATDASYVARPGDAGRTLSARVTATSIGYGTASATSPSTLTIENGGLAALSTASISGSAKVGSTLTATPPAFDQNGVTYSYQWFNLDSFGVEEPIAGATSKSYVVKPSDESFYGTQSSKLRVWITSTREGFDPVANSADTSYIGLGTLSISTPASFATSRTAFTAVAPVVKHTATTTTFSWVVFDGMDVAGQPISGKSLSRATVTGKRVELTATTTAAGYETATKKMTVQKGVAPVATGSTALTGTARVSSPIAAPSMTFAPSATTLAYRWFVYSGGSWKTISGAKAATFTPSTSYLGKKVRVAMTASRSGYASRVVTSKPSAAIAAPVALVPTVDPVVTGTVGVYHDVSVTSGTWNPAPSSVSYQWLVSANGSAPFQAISGATSTSLSVPATAAGKFLSVKITAKKSGHPTGSTIVPAGAITSGITKNLTLPTVSENPVGVWTVTDPGTWAGEPNKFEYTWKRIGPNDQLIYAWGTGSDSQLPFDTNSHPSYGLVLEVRGIHSMLGYSSGTVAMQVKNGKLWPEGGHYIEFPNGQEASDEFIAPAVDWQTSKPTKVTYQWQQTLDQSSTPPEDAWTDVPGATSATFIPGDELASHGVRVKTTGTAPGYAATTVASKYAWVYGYGQVQPGSGANAPYLTGSAVVGQQMTVHPGTWSAPNATFAYEWLWAANGSDFALQSTAKQWTMPADLWTSWGTLFVRIDASAPGYSSEYTYVIVGQVGQGELSTVVKPTVTKNANGSFTATAGTYSPAAVTTTLEWQTVDAATGVGTVVGTGATFTPTAAHDGKKIRLRVSALSASPAYELTYAYVTARAGTTIANVAVPQVTGPLRVGSALSVNAGTWTVGNPTLTYQWKRDGAAITGAKAAQYTQAAADLGKRLSVTVTAKSEAYGTATATGTATANTLSGVELAPTTSPVVSGTSAVGKSLSVTPGAWNGTGLNISFQWLRDGKVIPGATGSTRLLTAADATTDITVKVTASRSNYYAPATFETKPITIALGTLDAFTATVKPSGSDQTVNVGETVSVVTNGLPANAVLTYEWRGSADGSKPIAIAGEQGSTFTPTAAHLGFGLLVVTATAPGYEPRVVGSAMFSIEG